MEPEFPKKVYENTKLSRSLELTYQTNSHPESFIKVRDETDKLPANLHVSYWDIFAILISISSHVFDVFFDMNLAYQYYASNENEYAILTVIFISFPALVNTAVSIRMYMLDKVETSATSRLIKTCKISWIFILAFQLAPVMRYIDSLKYALKARQAEKKKDYTNQRKYYELMLKEDSDVALLRVLECFLEAAPQQILQVAIVLVEKSRGSTLRIVHQAGSIISSLLSMAWSMASYHRSVRFAQENKQNMSWPATAIQFMWHFMITVSRILSIGAVASAFPRSTFSASALHWILMCLWLAIFERTRFCLSKNPQKQVNKRTTELFFCAILGLVYIFTYLTPGEGKTRNRYLVYYPLCFLENTAGIILWSITADSNIKYSWYYVPLIVSSIVPFLIGIIFMVVYYKYFHPQAAQKIHMPFCCTFQPNVASPVSPQGMDPNYRFNYINDINAKLNSGQTPESL